jgi:5-methylcytosine-specific restriction endonuclease McrA
VELHHIKATHEGGKTVINNLMPLHWICHLKVTHEGTK